MAEPGHDALRAFKTPSLRGAASRSPYMHAGQIGTLQEVLAHYAAAPEGHSELRPLGLSQEEREQLSAFLSSLEPQVSDLDHVAEALSQSENP